MLIWGLTARDPERTLDLRSANVGRRSNSPTCEWPLSDTELSIPIRLGTSLIRSLLRQHLTPRNGTFPPRRGATDG